MQEQLAKELDSVLVSKIKHIPQELGPQIVQNHVQGEYYLVEPVKSSDVKMPDVKIVPNDNVWQQHWESNVVKCQ